MDKYIETRIVHYCAGTNSYKPYEKFLCSGCGRKYKESYDFRAEYNTYTHEIIVPSQRVNK
jgi:predicted Fe-S protein YdhL (DUF1289 family)